MIDFIDVAVGTGGGVACERCHGSAMPATYTRTTELLPVITQAVADSRTLPGPNLALTGPEPFGHPDLPTLVVTAVEAGVSRLRIDTDASALRSQDNAAGVLAAGVRHFRFSLLGGSAGLHDVLAGAPGALDATLTGLDVLRGEVRAQGVTTCLSALVPICRHNLHDLPAIAAVAVEGGANAVLLRVDDPGCDLAAAIPWITAACDTGVVNGVWAEIEGLPFCLAPDHALHVSDVLRARSGAKAPACRDCRLDALCGGGPVDASGDLLAVLAPPARAGELAVAVSRARGRVGHDA